MIGLTSWIIYFVITQSNLETEIIPNFKLKEFACQHCTEVILDKELLIRLEIFRNIYGKPIHLTSAYRTLEDNLLVGGVGTSEHLRGRAVDIVIPKNPKRFIWILKKIFPVVIIYPERNYVHAQLKKG